MIRHHLTDARVTLWVWATSWLPAYRRRCPYARALAAIRVALLAALVGWAVAATAVLGSAERALAAGGAATRWWYAQETSLAVVAVALVLFPLVSLALPRRRGVAR